MKNDNTAHLIDVHHLDCVSENICVPIAYMSYIAAKLLSSLSNISDKLIEFINLISQQAQVILITYWYILDF